LENQTIIALSTPVGVSAIALIRLSGKDTIKITNNFFKGKDLEKQSSHTAHFGTIRNEKGDILDEVVVTIFIAPHSFTGENIVEISCHGSPYIIQKIIELFLSQEEVNLAQAGEFTQRAFLNGKMDLAQAEAVADLIASESEVAHHLAIQQMRGGFSKKIKMLREDFIQLAALMELELDFSEEDVEFANREELQRQLLDLQNFVNTLLNSFSWGNVVKNGVPVALIGKPNAGKSTLLNALLQEEKAIVSEIAGTTRDYIEDEKVINGVQFRFIDTAGLRETEDVVESLGIERTRQKIKEAKILVYLFDALEDKQSEALEEALHLQKEFPETKVILVANKIDTFARYDLFLPKELIGTGISAKTQEGLENLEKMLYENALEKQTSDLVITNARHFESLKNTAEALEKVEEGIDLGISTEMLASDMRTAIYHLGTITGEISHEDILSDIFSKFCIGK